MKATHYFESVRTLDELRGLYRKLAKENHPDKGGDTATMQAINGEYDRLSKSLINSNPTFTEARKAYEHQVSEEMKEVLKPILTLPGIEIEIIGSWIWVTGNTFTVKDSIKLAGYNFSHQRAAWYWHKGEYHSKSKSKMSMNAMRDYYGCQTVDLEEEKNTILQ